MACRSRAPNWREVLPIHPAAQLLPHMTEQELRELGEDIKARGLLQPIFIFQELVGGKDFRYSLLDGVNRTRCDGADWHQVQDRSRRQLRLDA